MARWPKEHRFGILLIECLTALGDIPKRGEAVAELQARIERYRNEAQTELAKRKETKQPENPEPSGYGGLTREQFEERKLRELTNPER